MIKIDESVCNLCGSCVDVCPMGVLDISRGYMHFDKDRCISCHVCVIECPVRAISITRR